MKAKAVRFVRDVLQDDERADEIEEEAVEDYAERKRVVMVNPNRRKEPNMARQTTPSRRELEERISELEDENQTLTSKLDSITQIVNDDDAEDDGEEDDADGEEDDADDEEEDDEEDEEDE